MQKILSLFIPSACALVMMMGGPSYAQSPILFEDNVVGKDEVPYRVLIVSMPSKLNPDGYCGAGSEVILMVYEIPEFDLLLSKRIASCLSSQYLLGNGGVSDDSIPKDAVVMKDGQITVRWEPDLKDTSNSPKVEVIDLEQLRLNKK